MSNEVAASSSQNIMDNHLSHSDEVAKDINNYGGVDNTFDDEVVDRNAIILDQASATEGVNDQEEMDNHNLRADYSDLIGCMDEDNFIHDESTNSFTVKRDITIRFDEADVKYSQNSTIMPEQLVYAVEYPARVIPVVWQEPNDRLNKSKNETTAESEKLRNSPKKKRSTEVNETEIRASH